MTTYYMVFLKSGTAHSQSAAEGEKLQQSHMANIRKMFADGKLVVAGPFTGKGDIRGIFILKVGSMEEAKALTEQDPMVKAGVLVMEIHPWMAAKGLAVPIK